MIDVLCESLLLKIQERKGVCEDRLLAGAFLDFTEYKSCVGKLQGLKETEEIIKRVYKDMLESRKPIKEQEESPYE